jgi:hypothetical protein
MERPRLTPKQAEALRDRIRPMLLFLLKCRQRLDVLGFDQEGAAYQAIDKAHSAVHGLFVTLHYESCGRAVGKPSEDRPGLTLPTDQAQEPPNRPPA